jgi:hypothetical protein
MVEPQRDRDQRAPGVADHDGPLDPELAERL